MTQIPKRLRAMAIWLLGGLRVSGGLQVLGLSLWFRFMFSGLGYGRLWTVGVEAVGCIQGVTRLRIGLCPEMT